MNLYACPFCHKISTHLLCPKPECMRKRQAKNKKIRLSLRRANLHNL